MNQVAPVGAQTSDGILVVDDIVKRFETPEGPLTAVDHVSLSVKPGEFLAVIGPSGCGKSTLFNIVGGLVESYEGTVTVAGDRVRGPHPAIGMVFQEESTFPWRSVVDNVAFPLEITGMRKAERLDRARHFISLVGLEPNVMSVVDTKTNEVARLELGLKDYRVWRSKDTAFIGSNFPSDPKLTKEETTFKRYVLVFCVVLQV